MDFDELQLRISEWLVRNPHCAKNGSWMRRAVIASYRFASGVGVPQADFLGL
jgi:hypothetical protein